MYGIVHVLLVYVYISVFIVLGLSLLNVFNSKFAVVQFNSALKV